MDSYYKKYLKYKKKYLLLKGGNLIEMPQLCFGSAQYELSKYSGINTFKIALEDLHINHIDGAENYGNKDYKNALKTEINKIPRDKLWITWKADNITVKKIIKIINELSCSYIDTFLIHNGYKSDDDFEELDKAKTQNLIRNYGISNCYDIETLQILKEKYDIKTIQIQARPPNGQIAGQKLLPDNFIEICNSMDINVMLYGTISGVMNSDNFWNVDILENINPYYLQKYCLGKKNVLMISSVYGNSICKNLQRFQQMIKGHNLLSIEKMEETENILQNIILSKQ